MVRHDRKKIGWRRSRLFLAGSCVISPLVVEVRGAAAVEAFQLFAEGVERLHALQLQLLEQPLVHDLGVLRVTVTLGETGAPLELAHVEVHRLGDVLGALRPQVRLDGFGGAPSQVLLRPPQRHLHVPLGVAVVPQIVCHLRLERLDLAHDLFLLSDLDFLRDGGCGDGLAQLEGALRGGTEVTQTRLGTGFCASGDIVEGRGRITFDDPLGIVLAQAALVGPRQVGVPSGAVPLFLFYVVDHWLIIVDAYAVIVLVEARQGVPF
jgi:hypothetical protein